MTLVAAVWMLDYALTSKPCSEATNIDYFLLRILSVAVEVKDSFLLNQLVILAVSADPVPG